jgi:hypothetical protein
MYNGRNGKFLERELLQMTTHVFDTGSHGRLTTAAICGGILLFSLCGAIGAPVLLKGLFTGPDGTRWLGPFLAWTGACITGFVWHAFGIKRLPPKSETFIAGICITFLTAIIIFIAMQRFTSGLRYTETYNEIMAMRLARGESIYPDPERAPVGTVYTPFFFILAGAIHTILPAGLSCGRLVSLAAFLATLFFLFRISVHVHKNTETALWTVALFCATYAPLDCLYDQSCVDTLQMCVSAVALYFFLQKTPRGDWAALFFCGLACFTKQSALYPFLVVLAGTGIAQKRRWWVYNPLLFWGAVSGLLIVMTGGWVLTYTITYPSLHGFRTQPLPFILQRFLLLQLPVWICLVPGLMAHRKYRFHAYLLAVLFASLTGIYKNGGGIHALFPVEPLVCVAAAYHARKWPLLLCAQLVLGCVNPFTALYPWKTIRDVDKRIVRVAAASEGDVWLPMDTYLYDKIRRPEWDNFCALFGPLWANLETPGRLTQAVEQRRFALILIRENSLDLYRYLPPHIREAIENGYNREKSDGLVIYRRKGR